MAETINLNVTPEDLLSSAEEIRRISEALEKKYLLLLEEEKRLKVFWKSDAGERQSRYFSDFDEEFRYVISYLNTDSMKLETIAENYRTMEETCVLPKSHHIKYV